jgi:dienelactone hydrolase
VVLQGIPIKVFTYHPPDCAQPSLLFIFHGAKRKAAKNRDRARALADRACMVVVAPLFDRDRFRNWRYQRGGIVRKGRVLPRSQWTVSMVAGLVDWARRREGRPNAPYYFFGHSAGGQFLSRVAAFAPPQEVVQIVIANPSTHVMATLDESAPYGLGGVFAPEQAEARLKELLALPVTIYLGSKDTGEKQLTKTAGARRQGAHRLERGLNAFQTAHALAKDKGWTFHWRLVMASGVGHTLKGMLAAPELFEAFGFSADGKRSLPPGENRMSDQSNPFPAR